jgi:hypothetical protein
MARHLFLFFLVSTMFLFVYQAEGRTSRVSANDAKDKYLLVPGRVKLEDGSPAGSVVQLIDLESKQIVKSIEVPSSGKFDLELNYFQKYKIIISHEGYYEKSILVSTVVPHDVWEKDSIFPPFSVVITLYQRLPDTKLSFEGKICGKVAYSPNGILDNFDSVVFISDEVVLYEIKSATIYKDANDFNQKMEDAL